MISREEIFRIFDIIKIEFSSYRNRRELDMGEPHLEAFLQILQQGLVMQLK
jgi:hypothetical protein